jgi:putative SOS response-associated peptidase YedK
MCANYTPSRRDQLEHHFGVAPPDSEFKAEAYPADMAPFIRPPRGDSVPGDRAAALGMFGIAPHWAKEPMKLARNTYNARTETLTERPSFRNAWKRRQFCIIPAASIFEPCYETGKAVRWEIGNADGSPLAIAGLWEYRQDGPTGLPLLSYTMLTINADGHEIFQRMHKPNDEKRMVVLLSPDQYDEWLHCPVEDAPAFFEQRYPAERLVAHAAPKTTKASAQQSLPGA